MPINVADATKHARERDKKNREIINEELTSLTNDIDKMIEAQFNPSRPEIPMTLDIIRRFRHISEPEIVGTILAEITVLYRQAGWIVSIPSFPRTGGPEALEFKTSHGMIPPEVCGYSE